MLIFRESSSSPEKSATIIQEKIFPQLTPTDKILVIGNLGAGKTFMIKKLLALHGITNSTSPTFTLIHHYQTPKITLLHLDLYRLNHFSELIDLDIEKEFSKKQLMLIEWGDKFPELMSLATKKIIIEITGEKKRKISLEKN